MDNTIFNHCDWCVGYIIDGATQDDRADKVTVIAMFRYPTEAKDFIKKCMPNETKHRFFVTHKENIENSAKRLWPCAKATTI